MRVVFSLLPAALALALPLFASGQSLAPASSHAAADAPARKAQAPHVQPLWQDRNGHSLSVVADTQSATASAPVSGRAALEPRGTKADTALQFNVSPGVYARAGVSQRGWLSSPVCPNAQLGASTAGCAANQPLVSSQEGEVGAGYANRDLKLDLSVGQSRTEGVTAETLHAANNLPRVLPSNGGVGVAEPLLFPDSTTTSISARGQVKVLPGTKLDLGASQGRVHFLPGTGAAIADDLNQTTLSLGIEHGRVSGTIVGRMLQPALPGAVSDGAQRWAGIDLGVSVRLPWQGELSFGAQNVWSSGRQPLLNPQDISPEQARVPYVQYHQEL
ncbi:MAG TPA: hypothetical protein VJ722_11710 [Rhodanobacteraceae bacterium]|nr:hypothetical protein [Rhodanobacteraceae bacterium]